MKKDLITELYQLVAMLIALLLLLRLAQYLASKGAFSAMPVKRQPMPPLLIAYTNHRSAKPGTHAAMIQIAAAAQGRGVQEERGILGEEEWSVARGELAGVYHAVPHAGMAAPAELGIVIDVGTDRVTPAARAAWEKRLVTAGVDGVSVRIVNISDAVCAYGKCDGGSSQFIRQWRAYRKLKRHWGKAHGRGKPNLVLETISESRNRVFVAIPVDCTKSIYSP